MNAIHLNSFNAWMGWALSDLSHLPDRDAPQTRRIILDQVCVSVRHALAAANAMGCAKRKAACLRVLNWLRSA